jgi:tetratricopeptide (TPR) repeat protein
VTYARWTVRTAAALGVGLWLLCVPPSAAAQEAKSQAAEALFRQAKALLDAGDLAQACEKFAASNALEPGLGTLLYLGDCYERSTRFASALATFRAAEHMAHERDDAAREQLASVRAAALAPRAPTLEVRARGGRPLADLQITVNGVPLGENELNHPIPRDAGDYEVRFSAPGHEAYVSRVQLRNGATRGVVVSVPQLVSATSRSDGPLVATVPPAPPAVSTGGGRRVAAWVSSAAGLAFGVASGVFAALASAKNSDSKAACDPLDANRCGPDGVRLRNDAKDLAAVATVTGVVGGVAFASGVILFASSVSSSGGTGNGAVVGVSGAF